MMNNMQGSISSNRASYMANSAWIPFGGELHQEGRWSAPSARGSHCYHTVKVNLQDGSLSFNELL